jgi:hypothetical protein
MASFTQINNAGSGNQNFVIKTRTSDEIKVYVNGVLKTATTHYNISPYSSTGTSTVVWTTGNAPGSSDTVRIVRDTKILKADLSDVEGVHEYTAGSSVKAGDLNANQVQVLRALEEQDDQKIQTYDIEDKAVTRDKIALDAIDGTRLADDAVDSEHIAADSIDSEHYAPGSVDATAIASNAVTTVKILNDNVTMEKLGSGALPTDITVSTDNIVNGTITTADIGADQITNALIADDQIDSEHYVDGSVDRQHLSADIIDSTRLADESVNSEHFVDGSIDREHLAADIVDSTKIADDAVRSEHIQADAVTDSEILTGTLDNRYYTETELDAGQLDNRYFTEQECEDNFLRQNSSETIASGVTWNSSDAFVATTAAIDLRVIELVDNVGGFVPIANETSFPTANPDINTSGSEKGGTIVSVQAASTDLAPSGTTVTIANGRGSGLPVIITGVSATIPSGFGFLVETTATDHTYAFHRLVPKATEVSTVAANAVNIAAAGANVVDINNFADLYQISTSAPTQRADSSSLQVGDLWFDSSSNKVLMIYDGSSGDGFTAATPNASDLININIVAGQLTFQEDLGLITNSVATGTGNQTLNTVAGIASNVTTVAGISSDVTAVAADATDIGAVAGKATEIGRLGTADAVADLAILGTTAIVSDLDTLADISSNITTVAGISSNVTTVAGIASNVTAVAGNATNINAVAADATDIGAVAGKATEIGRLGTADAVADLAILGTTDVVADLNTLATSAIVSDMDTLADISSNITTVAGIDSNVTTVAGISANVTTVAGISSNVTSVANNASNINSAVSNASNINSAVSNASNINSAVSNATNINTVAGISANVTTVAGIASNVTTVATNNSNVSTVATNITDVNTFANRYRIASSAPSTSLDVGDLYFDTSSNELRVYNGSAWQGGVTATGSLAGLTANTFSGNQTINANIIVSGTVDGRDVAADGTKLDGIESAATADQTAAEIRTLVESASDSNVFTDADHSKLNGIEASATADQTASEIVALIAGQTIAPNVITTTNLTLDFGSIA